ncbi:MAG: hemolysin activation protein [Prevotella sp.]|nr:hemolysin activation protein [Prevotella sp.]
MTKYPAENDVAVLLIFFTRQETLKRTFEAIRKARPSHLYLYQDGPRNPEEAKKIETAKQIVADDKIDWDCEVQRNYHTENSGAWASNYQAQRWAFSLYDKCVVIEDDSTPSVSFIHFCKEMLDRYENDERITMIGGYNHEEKTDAPYDYLFTTVFSIWGWASWRRVVDKWDEDYQVVDNDFDMRQLEAVVKARGDRQEMVTKLRKHKEAGVPIYETVYWSYNMLHSGLTIVPTRNMIQNTAVSEESAHYQSAMKTLPKRMQEMLTMPSYEMTFPLRHPHYVIEDVEYKQRVYRIMAWGHPWIKIGRSMEELFRNLRYGNFKAIWNAIVFRVKKNTGHINYQ